MRLTQEDEGNDGDKGLAVRHKKISIAIIIALFVLAAAGAWLWFDGLGEQTPVDRSDGLVKMSDGEVQINLTEMVSDDAEFEGNKIQYRSPFFREFTLTGLYLGKGFMATAYDGEKKQLEVVPVLNPSDGVPQVYMVPLIEENRLRVDIYIDREFRQLQEDINVAWGSSFQKFRSYNTSVEVFEGVYRDTVFENDLERIEQGRRANVAVGNFTRSHIEQGRSLGFIAVFLH